MLDNTKVKISNILSSLIPDFIEADNPKFKEFLEQYYIFEEREYGTTDIADDLSEYKNIAKLTEIETVRAQTIPVPGTLVPPQVIVLTTNVLSFDDTINVTHTKGFPDTYGLLKIDDEIITYTGKTATSFTGCARGFSGISAIETEGNPDFLTFSETESAEHNAGTVVLNLGFVFIGQFYSKFKGQFLPGVESRPFASGLSVENILTRAKDFYTSKGTDSSIDLLFKVLYGKDVVIDKPFNNTISVSDAEWQISDEIIVEALTGNPMNLKLYNLFQGSATEFSTSPTATAAISNVQEVFLGTKTYHKIFLSRDTVKNKFEVNNRTKVLEKGVTESVVTVDSTVGFGNTGFFWYPNTLGTYEKVEYTSKSYNQFFGCVGIANTSLEKDIPIIGDQFVWGYENNDLTKVCQMRVVGSVVNSPKNEIEDTQFYSVGDKIGVKFLGDTIDESDIKFNQWIYNNSIDFDVVITQDGPGGTPISGIDVSNKIITTIDKHSVKKLSDSTIDIFEKFTGKVLDVDVTVTSVGNNIIGYYGNGTNGELKNGAPVVGTHYVVRYNLRKTTPTIGLDYLLSDIPNTFVDKEENCIAAFSGYPSGGFNTTDRSKTFTSNDVGLVGSGITITNHKFLQGEKVYYQPLTASTGVIAANENRSGIDTGIYYVSVVDDNNIKLSLTRQSIFTNDTIWDITPQSPAVGFPTGTGTDEHKITPYSLYVGGSLKNQNNLKRIRKTPVDAENNKNIIGPVGVAVNGLELHSAISNDAVYYGQIDKINVFSPGKEYNIVEPPNVSVADSVGSGIKANVHLGNGYISDVILTSSGWDYQGIPAVSITGGNGTGAECKAKMKYITHQLSFNDSYVDTGAGANNYGRFNLSREHRLLQGEPVVYNSDPNGSPVGVGSTNVGLSTSVLTDGAVYYVIKNTNTSFSLALTRERAVAGINTIQFTTDGAGIHKITAKRKRRIVDEISIKTPGKNFAYNKVDVDSYKYAPSTQIGILTTFTGISTENNYIYARNHNFGNGDVVTYSHSGTAISGLSTELYYKVTVVDGNNFKLSEAGTATSISNHNFDNKIYSNLKSIGVGTHTFNYPNVKLTIEGITAVGVGSTVMPSYTNATAYANVKGSVSNIFIKRGGIGYGSSTIINHIRQPNITLQTGQDARVGCIVDSDGVVTSTVINDPGKNYSTPPILKVIGSGVFARLKANVIDGKIDSIEIIDGGINYTKGETIVEVIPAGSEALFNADVHKWTIDNVQRYSHILDSVVYQDTVQLRSTIKSKGNKICSFYPQKQLRMDLDDNLNSDKTEKISDLKHSPIIGWAYDGNPIFGPYGKPPGIGVKKMQSSYIIDAVGDSNLRPQYNNGYFVEDYFYDQNSGDLDEFNGKYLTPGESDDFPNGTYGYYASIKDTPETTPTFPYLPFRHYNETDEYNYELLRDQSDAYINTGEYKRNVTNYGYNADNTRYNFHTDTLSSKALLEVEEVRSAGVTTVSIDVVGDKYRVGELISFSDPSSVSGKIKEVVGKEIQTITLSETAVKNLKFQVIEDQVTAFSTVPHNYIDSELVQIAGISSALFGHIEGSRVVGVQTITTALSVGLANTANTGLTTFIKLSESTISDRFDIGDIIKIGNEHMRILQKDHYNNRFRVARTQNETSASATGIATGTVVEKVPHEFTYKVNKKVKNRNLQFTRKFNFDGELAVGIGSTVKSTIVGYSGISTIYKSIPQGAIYLPGHQFKTGDELSYVAYGSTIKYANNTDLTPEFDLAGIGSIYAIKFNNEFIGITTGNKVGIASDNVGFTTVLKYFTLASGHDHRFETIEDNITGESKRVQATVAVSTSHGLALNDNIKFSITPNLTQKYAFKFDDNFNKLVTNSIGFTTNLVGVGIGTTNSLINLTNHGYSTGDQVIYTATDPITPLETNTIYHVIKVSDSEIKLATDNYSATNKDPYDYIYFTNSGTGDHELSRIHPPLKFYRGNKIEFDVSDTSLSDFDINFYYDEKFESRFESDLIKKPTAIEFGDGSATSKITIDIDETFPETLYYKLEGTGPNYTSTYPSSVDTDVPNHSKIMVVGSDLNTTHRITGVGDTTFTVSLVGSAETTSYTSSGFSSAIYSTDSTNVRGGIHSLKVVNSLPVDTLPKVVSVATTTGKEVLFSEKGDDIGEILSIGVIDQGIEYSNDKTLAPKADAYTILKLKNVYTLDSVGIVTGGNNYTSPPIVTTIGNPSILCSASIIGNSVYDIEILANDSGLSKDLKMIPTVNSNGVKVISAESNFAINTVYLRAPVTGFTEFPFKVGDEVYIENINITDAMDGYNSSDYGNRNFTITEVNETGGQESIKYSIAGIGSTGGTYDTNNAFGRVVKVDDLAIFKPNLRKVEFVEGEKISQDNGVYGYVVKDGWDRNAQTLKIKGSRGRFEEDKTITSSLNNSKSIIQNVHDYDFNLTVDSITPKSTDWETNKGKLNFDSQRIHDNDYYQRFSYAIKGEVPYETWKEPITSLGHISGYKPFSDYEVLNGLGTTVGFGTASGDVILNVEMLSEASVYDRYYYDFVSDDTVNPKLTKIITFDSKVLTDYSESRSNKVLLLKDIGDQFTGKTKTFTGEHKFISADINAVNVLSGGSGNLTPIGGLYGFEGTSYNASTGVLTVVVDTTKHTPTNATYNPTTGDLVLTLPTGHGLTDTDYIRINPDSLKFKCEMDGKTAIKSYPRPGIDTTAYGNFIGITTNSATSISVNVGTSVTVTHNVTDAVFNPSTGIMTCTIGSHSLIPGTSIRFEQDSLTFQCEKDNYATDHSYPRAAGHGTPAATATRAGFGTVSSTITDISITDPGHGYTSAPSITVASPGIQTGRITDVGWFAGGSGFVVGQEYPIIFRPPGSGGSPVGLGTEARAKILAVTGTGGISGSSDVEITYGGYGYSENIWMQISHDGGAGIVGLINNINTGIGSTATATATIGAGGTITAITVTSPGVGYTVAPAISFDSAPPTPADPTWNTAVNIEEVTETTITVGIGSTFITDQSTHRWKPGYTGTAAVISGGEYAHEFSSADSNCIVSEHGLEDGATVSLADYSMTFRCDHDGFMTDHEYPRVTDPASTTNSKLNNGILAISNATNTNKFDVVINNPILGGQIVGLTTFALYTIGESQTLTSAASTERLFYKTVQPGIGVSVDTNTVTINGHSFSNGEPLEYSSHGGTRIGIATATIGAGTTTFLPDKVWAIVTVTDGVLDQKDFKLASSLSNANAGTALTITSIGTGNTHTFSVPSELATTRSLITIDNIIQSPLTSKVAIGISLSQAVGVGTTTLWLQDISKVEGGTLLRLEEEVMKVNTVGVGSTNSLNVDRGVMGTVAVAHTVGAGLTYLTGDYRIKDGNIHFSTPPYGPTGISSNTTRSSFTGRSYYRLDYQYNTTFDDVSEEFDGQTSKFMLSKDGVEIVGIETNYGMVLVNNIFQDLHYGEGGSSLAYSDYSIVGSGSSIDFTGTAANGDLPKGGIINEYSVFPGVGIQSAYNATGIAVVSAAGTISQISIGNSGSGYLIAPRVGVAITNYHFTHNFVSASPDCLTAGGGASGTLTPTFATYESTTGDLVLTIPNHTLTTSNTVQITNETLVFTCSRDGFVSEKKYPRASDPVAGIQTAITNANGNTITVNVGTGAGIGASFTASIDNGMVTGVTVTNPGTGYTGSYQPILEIDPPSPWKSLPLTGGLGVGASMDVTVGTGGSVINFELSNPGYGYSTGDVLTLNPVPYKVGVTSTPFTITVNNRYQDKFSGWNFGKLLELDDLSYLFNGFRRSFLITRTVTNREYFSIIAKEGSGIVLANNLMIWINDVLQKPVVDYKFVKGTRITFREAPKRGSKFRMYLYVASRDDYFEVDVDQTVKEGDRLQIQPWEWGNIVGQDQRIIYELLASDTVETQTYSGVGIRTDDLQRPVVWTKQKSDMYIDGEVISKVRNYLEPQIMPNTNIIASVASTDTKIYVKNVYPTFSQYDDIATNLNDIRIVGLGATPFDSSNVEKIKGVSYSGDYGQVLAITTNTISSPIVAEQVKFLLTPDPECISDHPKPGIDVGDYFVIQDIFPNVATNITALGVNTSTTISVGVGSMNTVYQAYAVSVGSTTVEVTCNVSSISGITTTALPDPYVGATGRNAGSYTWGVMTVSRNASSESFDFYNQNGLAGIETSAYVSRILPLKTTL